MEQRLEEIRTRNRFIDAGPVPQIGCILLSSAVFFPRDMWIAQPSDWAPRNLTYQRYSLDEGEGLRVWRECQERLRSLQVGVRAFPISAVAEALEEQQSNGLALCKLHHAAFDSHIIGVRPDCTIHVRDDVLSESDGPMLIHGLQGFHNQTLRVPKREAWRPSIAFLEERYVLFRRAV